MAGPARLGHLPAPQLPGCPCVPTASPSVFTRQRTSELCPPVLGGAGAAV